MRIAVTGAAGYIGGWLVSELAGRGHEVHAQDLVRPFSASVRNPVPWATFCTFDLRSAYRHAWLRNTRPEVVVHLAALYGRVWGEQDMYHTAGMNAGLTAELARDCAADGIQLMFMSSSEVYGKSANHGIVYPDSPLEPMNMYGLSKKWGEEACHLYAPEGLMVPRLNMPYGPARWPPRVGEKPKTSGQPGTVGYNVLHSMVWEASLNFGLVVHEGTVRCLTWVGDTVRGLAMILEAGQPGTWNVNRNDDHRPVADIARLVIGMTGSASEVRHEPPPPRVTMRKSLDNAGLLALGWVPGVELDEGAKRTWEYFSKFDRDGVWRG